jgi:hypothetical protein
VTLVVADLQWGNVAEWAAALFTGAAFFVTYRLLRHEAGVRQSEEERLRRQQAEKVVVWTVGFNYMHYVGDGQGGVVRRPGNPRGVDVRLQNLSSEPVYALIVEVRDRTKRFRSIGTARLDILEPGATPIVQIGHLELADDAPVPLASVIFRDARGQLWSRTIGGKLQEIDTMVDTPPRWRRVLRRERWELLSETVEAPPSGPAPSEE